MGRAPCCDKANVKRGPWSPDEDMKLKEFIKKHGTGGNWIALPQKAGLKRCGKSCRLRWLNYLRPNIKHGEFSDHEDRIICSLFASIGTKWSIIAAQLPGRTDNDIKNYWNTKLKKKLMSSSTMPIPSSHHQTASSSPQSTYYYTDPIKPNLVVPSNLLNDNISKPTTTETMITSPLNVIQERITDLTHHYTPQMLGNDHTSCSNSPDGSSTNQFIFNGDHHHQQMGNYFNSEPVHEDHRQELRFGDDNHRLNSNHNHQWSSHDHEHHNGLWEEINTPNTSSYLHHYTLEEIKQLITSNSSNSDTSDDFLLYY